MTSRALIHLVRELRLTGPYADARQLLSAAAGSMRLLRGLPPGAHPVLSGAALDLPGMRDLLLQDEALGHLYQAYNAPALEAAYRATARDGRKFTEEEIPAVTQLFTPRWVVDFLVQNTLGRLWCEMHPDTESAVTMKFLLTPSPGTPGEGRGEGDFGRRTAIDEPNHPHPIPLPEYRERELKRRAIDLRILDPACGTMNFGLAVVDLLTAMYREEIDRAGSPGWPAEPSVRDRAGVPQAILRHNLFGTDIDPLAIDLARWTLELKTGASTNPDHLRVADGLFDRLPRDFDVVVTNPPYLCSRNLPAPRVRELKKAYPAAWRDEYACFVCRCLSLVGDGGRAGILAMQSFMFTGAYEAMRVRITEQSAVEAIAHFGPGLFAVGNPGTLQTAGVVLRREHDPAVRAAQPVAAFRLVDEEDKEAALTVAVASFDASSAVRQSELASLPRGAWAYWTPPELRKLFHVHPKLAHVALPRQGLATTDNARFVRCWWEVEPHGFAGPRPKWALYAKGGRFRRWYESPRHRVNWEEDGREIKASILTRYPYLGGKWQWVAKNTQYYGRPGVTYSYLTSGPFSARRLEPGSIFDVAGSSLFPDDPLAILAVLNSSVAAELLSVINPTVNFQVGDLAELPVPENATDELRDLVTRAIELTRKLDAFDEATTDFIAPPERDSAEEIIGALKGSLRATEQEIDVIVRDLYGLRSQPADVLAPPLTFDRTELAARWASFALLRLLDQTDVLWTDDAMATAVGESLARGCGERTAAEVAQTLGGLESFLLRQFYPWHVKRHEQRPPIWAFTDGARTAFVHHARASAKAIHSIFSRLGLSIPDGWERHVDDGIRINLAPLAGAVADRALTRRLTVIARDLDAGRYAFSETAQRSSRLVHSQRGVWGRRTPAL